MPLPLELSLAFPTLHRVMGPPNPHPSESPPATQPSVEAAFPPCILPKDSLSAEVVLERFNLQSHRHGPWSCPSSQNASTARACDADRQMHSSSQCKTEITTEDISLTLTLAHDTTASSTDEKRACASRELGSINCLDYANVLDFDLDRTLNEGSSRGSEDDEGRVMARKKLRLSKEESALLEERFKEHSTLTPKQKNVLAKQLNLRPRQVEVWFQNRRARTKLKQTEVDCELLKKCCASLTDENRRLQMEVAKLRALKVAQHSLTPNGFCMPMVAESTLSMCPRCQCISTRAAAPSSSTTTSSSSLREAPTCPLTLSQQQKSSPALSG